MKIIYTFLFLIPFLLQAQNTELLMQKGHSRPIDVITFSPDGSFFATGAADNLIILTETKTGISFKTIRIHTDPVKNITFSPDGKKMISANYREIFVYDLEKNKMMYQLEDHYHNDTRIAISPEGNELLFEDNLYDLQTGKKLPDISDMLKERNFYTPDGSLILSVWDNEVHVLDRKTNTEKFVLATQQKPRCAYVTRDSKYYYCANDYGNWQQWSLATGKLEGTREGRKGNSDNVNDDHFMLVNDQHTLFAAQDFYNIYIYDLWTGRLLKTVEYATKDDKTKFTAAAFSPDGNVLICASFSEGRDYKGTRDLTRVRYIDTKSGRTIRTTKGFESSANKIVISPDEKHLAILGNEPVRIWEMDRAGGRMFSLNIQTRKYSGAFWSPDNRVVYVNSNDRGGPSFLYDLNTMDYQTRDEHLLHQYSAGIRNVSEDYKLAVSTGRIVEFSTGKPICEIDTRKDYSTKDFKEEARPVLSGETYITPDNKKLFVLDGVITTNINVYDIENCEKKAIMSFKSIDFERNDADLPVFAIRSGKIIATGLGKIAVFDVGKQEKILEIPNLPIRDDREVYDKVTAMDLNPAENMLAVAYLDTTVRLYDIPSGKLRMILTGHELPVRSVKFRANGQLLTASPEGQIKFWNVADGKELGTLVPVDSTDFIIKTTGNYYFATKNALRNMAFKVGKKIFPFEQFDLKYNRPDIVFKQLDLASDKQIKTYNMAYKKRLQKNGFTEEMLADDYNLPSVEVKDKFDIPLTSSEDKLTFAVNAKDDKYKLNRLNVYVNDVSVYGARGRKISGSVLNKDVTLNLSPGSNRVQVSVTNEKGLESMWESFEVSYEKEGVKPDLYMLVVGVSEYTQKENNLKYAAKDAQDLAKAFQVNKQFNKITIKQVLNTQATKENILNEAAMLGASKEQDVVIVYVSGHGLLDDKLDYYLATTDVDFLNPAARGLSYSDLESVIDTVPARNRLIMIDACHSGEVDKDEVQLAVNESVSSNANVKVVTKGSKAVVPKAGLNNSFAFMQIMFDDVSKGMGATIISAAGGMEFALESPDWNNGVFTYAILNGFKTNEADLNKDGVIRISELKEYVTETVIKLTEGRQVPNARKVNLNNDFIIR